jgi:tetratricopeptide (TPR) repeat protein
MYSHPPSDSKKLSIAFSLIGGAILLFHLIGAVAPLSWNWGFHHFGFLHIVFIVIGLLLMTSSLVPSIQQKIIHQLEKVIQRFNELSKFQKRSILSISSFLFASICWFARENIYLLGDGYLMLRILPTLQSASDQYFAYNEPLPFFVVWKLWQLIHIFNSSITPEIPFIIISILSGLMSAFIFWSISKAVSSNSIDRLLTFFFFFATGGTQLFFGYVENYPLVYVIMLLFLWSSILYIQNKINLIVPSVIYGFLFVSHFGTLIFAPTLIILYYHSFKAYQKKEVLASFGTIIITTAVLLWLCGYSFKTFTDHLLQNSNRFIQIISDDGYRLFSWGHLINLINIQVLISPFALIIIIISLFTLSKQIFKEDGTILFLVISAASGIIFTAIFNFRIGMSRDWDLIAPFMLGIVISAGYAWNKIQFEQAAKRKLFIMMIVVSIIHTVSLISVNANEKMSLKRFEALSDSRLWSKESMLSGYEELAIYYRGLMDGESSIKYYKKYIQLDSSNTRILQSIAHVYFLMNNREEEIKFLEKAVTEGTNNWDLFQKLGGANYKLQRYANAASYYLRAISLDLNNPDAYLGAGLSFRAMNDNDNMKKYLDLYLRMNPDAPDKLAIQKLIQKN